MMMYFTGPTLRNSLHRQFVICCWHWPSYMLYYVLYSLWFTDKGDSFSSRFCGTIKHDWQIETYLTTWQCSISSAQPVSEYTKLTMSATVISSDTVTVAEALRCSKSLTPEVTTRYVHAVTTLHIYHIHKHSSLFIYWRFTWKLCRRMQRQTLAISNQSCNVEQTKSISACSSA